MNYTVDSISHDQTHEWLMYKHYAHRIPSISYSFGLFDSNGIVVGVCTFGRPMAHTLIKNAFGGLYQDNFLELNRLCVNDGLPKNTLSHFVSQCLKKLPPPNGRCQLCRYKHESSWLYISSD